ncbi:nutrient deprivation-induced protein [Rhizobium calliandrae]|uniref:Nutrient deprivation-induced protein n=1 Tax=Rhizobium calliandrae TaxID=1312182 RepID=A0ABT7KT13_9HYPH|nr:nutrient deprivation-induced protein [Rhizobium calliandrae]MDL2410764.1 nutrient deprivation-induced protein [Rhizobium calliandrae]
MTDELSGSKGERSHSADISPATDLKNKTTDDIRSMTRITKQASSAALESAGDVVTEQTHFAARQVSGIAAALEKAGAELEGSDQRQVGRYARQIGRSVAGIAKNIEGKDLGQMAIVVENFGRKQPLVFLGIAALAGLTASRFLIASGNRTEKATTAAPSADKLASESKDHPND